LAIFKNRLPSSQEAIYAFVASILPIHIWLIFNVMREIPAWILRLSLWDMIGVIAYSLAFALVETAIIFLGVVLLGVILPKSWFRHKFVALSSTIVFLASFWVIFLHYNIEIIDERLLVPAVIWGGTLVLALILAITAVLRSTKIEAAIDAFVKRLAALSFIYLFLDLVGIILVIIRNL
jgi:hypothetical protein